MREYAALPHEYWEEMADLTDEEWGRLTRALLRYSITGEETDLPGTERLFWVRVKNREGRYQAAFEEAAEKRKEHARVAASARWGKSCPGMPEDAPNANTNTKTKSKAYPYTEAKDRRGVDTADEMKALAMAKLDRYTKSRENL